MCEKCEAAVEAVRCCATEELGKAHPDLGPDGVVFLLLRAVYAAASASADPRYMGGRMVHFGAALMKGDAPTTH